MSDASPRKASPVRPGSNQDLIDGLTYAIYARLARRIPQRITPNQLTLLNFTCALAASACLIFIDSRWGLPASALLLYLHTLFDSLDGIHARQTGQTSRFGHFLDHFLDGFAWLFLYLAVLLRFSLFSPLFVFLFLLRVLLQSLAFLTQLVTGELHLPRLGPTCEAFGYCFALVFTFFYPGPILSLPVAWTAPFAAWGLTEPNHHLQFTLVESMLLLYLYALPTAALSYFHQARRAARE